MHQTLTTPETEPKTAKKQRARRKRQIIIGVVGFLVLWLIVSIMLSKREKPIPVTTDKAVRQDDSPNRFRDGQSATGNRSENFAGSSG